MLSNIPARHLSPPFYDEREPVFLIHVFNLKKVVLLQTGERDALKRRNIRRGDLDVYGQCLNRDRFQTVVVRESERHMGLFVQA